MDTTRVDRLDTTIAAGRIIRNNWTDGHECVRLLAALSPEAGAAKSYKACPAEVMPAWLAELTLWLGDEPSAVAWPGIIRRYAALARRWGVLDETGWERARIGALTAIVSEARTHVMREHAQALYAIDDVLAWLGRGAPEAKRSRLSTKAWKAADKAATDAAWAAAATAAWATEDAAWDAADAAAHAADAADAAGAAEAAAASDRIASGVLDAIEREIATKEEAQ